MSGDRAPMQSSTPSGGASSSVWVQTHDGFLSTLLRRIGIGSPTLRFRVTTYITLLLVLLMTAVVLLVEYRTRDLLYAHARGEALDVARRLAAEMVAPMLSADDSLVRERVAGAVRGDSRLLQVVILDLDGRLRVRAGTEVRDPRGILAPFPLWRLATLAPASHEVVLGGVERDARVIATICPILAPDGARRLGAIVLGFSLELTEQEVGGTRVVLFVTGLLAIIAGFLMAGVVAGRITRPLLLLAAATEEVAQGQLGRKIRVTSQDELGALADNFNRMTSELDLAHRRNLALNRDLETKVVERTRELSEKSRQLEESYHATKQAKEKINYLMEYHRNILDSVSDGILAIDRQFIVQGWSKAMERHLGRRRDDAIGKALGEVLGDVLREAEREEWMSRLTLLFDRGESMVDMERSFETAEGQTVVWYVEMLPLKDETGATIGATTLVRDVTGIKARERQLLNLERLRALGQLAGGVAHSFNNLLGVVLGRVQLLKRQTSDPALQAGLDTIEKVATEGAVTVRRIQDYTRVRTEQEFEPVDLAGIVEDSVEITRGRWKDDAEKSGKVYSVVTDIRSRCKVRGDPAELREVLTNLIINALDAMPGGGEVRIGLEESNAQAVLSVADTGVGMTDEVRARIFDPFFTTKGPSGTGLGLSVSYGILKRHNGLVAVESHPGGGSVFRLRLPLLAEIARPAPEPPPAAADRIAHILILDDELYIRELLEEIIGLDRHTCRVAASGREGIELFKREKFELVITDLGMAEMSGYDVVREIRATGSKVPVILVTGWGEQIESGTILERGINAVVTKPFEIEWLLGTISRVLAPEGATGTGTSA